MTMSERRSGSVHCNTPRVSTKPIKGGFFKAHPSRHQEIVMNAVLKSLVRSAVVGVGLVGASVALAHPPYWANNRWDREPVRYERAAEYDYARVVDVDPIVRHVAIDSPQRECWSEDRQVYGQ